MPDQELDLREDATAGGEEQAEAAGTLPDGAFINIPLVDFVVEPDGVYLGFGLAVTVRWVSGLAFAPLAGARRGAAAVWRASAEYSVKTIVCVAQKSHVPPTMPHIDTGDSNDVLLSAEISASSPADAPDGNPIYTVVAQYYYLMQTPYDMKGGQNILIPNSVLKAPAQRQLDPANFSRYLAGPTVPPPGYDGHVVNF
jgi:hypothetical protein